MIISPLPQKASRLGENHGQRPGALQGSTVSQASVLVRRLEIMELAKLKRHEAEGDTDAQGQREQLVREQLQC